MNGKTPRYARRKGDGTPTQVLYTWTSEFYAIVGRGGALFESIALNRRVVGSTPALAAM